MVTVSPGWQVQLFTQTLRLAWGLQCMAPGSLGLYASSSQYTARSFSRTQAQASSHEAPFLGSFLSASSLSQQSWRP